jgi:hypothetical protein
MKTKIIFTLILATFLSILWGSSLKDRERLVFDIRYGVVTAGEATLNLTKTTHEGKDAWRIFVTAETNSFFDKMFRVRDTTESIACYHNLYSFRFTKNLHEGNYRQHRIHQNFLDQNFTLYSRFDFRQGRFHEPQRIEIPSNTFDIMSAFYYVRTLDLQPGQRIPVNITADGKSYDAEVQVVRRERIDTIFGRKNCLVIRPILDGEAIFKQTDSILIWLLDEDCKTPVQLQSKVAFGSFRAVLKRVETVR